MVANTLRLLDADIFAYALYDESPAHTSAWEFMETCLRGGIPLNIAPTTILETYNTLYWYYRVRPMKSLLRKISLTIETLQVVETSLNGLRIAEAENIPLGDGLLLATARQNNIPIIVSNDKHIKEKTAKYGLIYENPILEETRKKLSQWNPQN
jgi:predicted nucleic acid-binding protein